MLKRLFSGSRDKYISYCTDHDSVELGEVCSFNGELYRMVSREDKQDTDSAKTVCCEFICVTPLTKDFNKKDGGEKNA